MHSALQAMLEGEDAEDVYKTFWDSEKDKSNEYSRYNWEALNAMGPILLARFARLHRKKIKVFKMEERIYSSLGDVTLEGTPDVLGWFEDKPSVIDFKTAAYRYPKEKLICNEQMPLYAYMAEKEYGFKAEQYVYIVLIKGNEPSIQIISHPLIKEAQKDTLANISFFCKELDKREQYPQNRSNCLMGTKRCDYFEVCHGK
jgi:hypothetical protein